MAKKSKVPASGGADTKLDAGAKYYVGRIREMEDELGGLGLRRDAWRSLGVTVPVPLADVTGARIFVSPESARGSGGELFYLPHGGDPKSGSASTRTKQSTSGSCRFVAGGSATVGFLGDANARWRAPRPVGALALLPKSGLF